MSNNRIQALIKTLQESFNGSPWYGVSVMEKLEVIDWHLVNEKPLGSSKSVAVLLKHMVNWRIFALKKIQGNPDFDIEINSEEDWPKIQINTEQEWVGLLKELKETQLKLIQYVSVKEEIFLNDQVPGKNYDFEYLIRGISEHDIYHLGQIGLVYGMIGKD